MTAGIRLAEQGSRRDIARENEKKNNRCTLLYKVGTYVWSGKSVEELVIDA